MSCAHGNAELVEQHAHIVVVDAIDEERNHAAFLPGSAEDAHTGDLHQSLGGDGEQPVLVGGDVVESESFHIVDGSAKGGNIYIIGRSCLKLKRQFGVGGAFPRHMTNHFASALVGIHALKQRFLAVEHTHAGGTVHLVRREHIEVGIEVTHVDFQVRGSLCAIYEHGNAVAVGNGYHLLHRIYGAEHIDYRLGNGLAGIQPEETDVIVIAGMGGENIASILEAAPWTAEGNHTLLLAPHTKAEELRRFLMDNGYKILREKLVYDRGTIYPVMEVMAGYMELSLGQLWGGAKLAKDPLGDQYMIEKMIRLFGAVAGLNRSERPVDREKADHLRDVLTELIVMREEWRHANCSGN